MQERYLGDVHDYIKFALLRHLHVALNVRIGVNWYKTIPEQVDQPDNRHGNNRAYRRNQNWQNWEPDLFQKLEPFQNPDYRTFENFKNAEILLKDTIFYRREVRYIEDRSTWHENALTELSEAGLIFLDPDNGFQVESMTNRTQAKYALYKEAFDYYDSGKIVIGIQFASRVKPKDLVEKVREKLIQSKGCSTSLPVLRGRVTPNILFFTVSPSEHVKKVREALSAFETKSPVLRGCKKLELIR